MKKILIFSSVAALLFTACKKDLQDVNRGSDLSLNAGTSAFVDTITLPQIIKSSMTLSPSHLYLLKGKVYVTGGTLSILAGTQVQGAYAADPNNASALVITKTGKISAKGKENNPVVFTSYLAGLPGGRTSRVPGDWGGVVILGNAPTNKPTTQFIEGINPSTVPAGVDVTCGGSNPSHSAGVLAYVRIEFAGAAIAPNNELNSLTFGGVGKGTGVRFVMASMGADDAFEFFGGNVAPKYLIANSQNDDGFDFDFGYVGDFQFGISVKNSLFTYFDSNGIECDNENPSNGATPTTRPQLSNLTIIGQESGALPGTLNAARFRRGTDLRARNSIYMGYNIGISFENTLASNTPTFFRNNGVHAFTDVDNFVSPPTVAPWGTANLSATGATPANWVNDVTPPTFAQYNGSALVYKAGGPFDPGTAGGIDPSFFGTTTNFLTVPYIGALGPGSPVRDANGVVTVPNNWAGGSAGVWVVYNPS